MVSKRAESNDIHKGPHQRQPEDVPRGSEEKDPFPQFDRKRFEWRWGILQSRHGFVERCCDRECHSVEPERDATGRVVDRPASYVLLLNCILPALGIEVGL
jgi:hypothetical protein